MGVPFEQMGNALADASLRVQQRNAAVARARDFNQFSTTAAENLRVMQQTEDMSDPGMVVAYNTEVSKMMNDFVEAHGGRFGPNSKAELFAKMDGLRAGLLDDASRISAEAGVAAVQGEIERDFNERTNVVMNDPTQYMAVLDSGFASLANYADVLTPAQIMEYENSFAGAVTEAAVNGILLQPGGSAEAARLLATSPALARYLSPQTMGRITTSIRQARALEMEADSRRFQVGSSLVDAQGNVIYTAPAAPTGPSKADEVLEMARMFFDITGEMPSSEMLAKAAFDFNAGSGGVSKVGEAEEMVAFFEERGIPMDPGMLKQFFGVDVPEGERSLTSQVVEMNALSVAAGGEELTPDQLLVLFELRNKPGMSFADKVQEAETLLKREMTESELAVIGGFMVPGKRFLAEEIRQTNILYDAYGLPPLSPDQVRAMTESGLYEVPEGQSFGGGVAGETLNTFNTIPQLIVDGTATPEEIRTLEIAATDYVQSRTFNDPVTGEVVTQQKSLPTAVAEALRSAGVELPGASIDGLTATSGPNAGGADTAPGSGAGEDDTAPGDEAPETADMAEAISAMPPNLQGRTVYGMADLLQGPEASFDRTLADLPVNLRPAPEQVSAKQFFDVFVNEVVSVLQTSPRFEGTERAQIKKELNLRTDPLSNSEIFRDQLRGLDSALQERLNSANASLRDSTLPLAERQRLLQVVNSVTMLRKKLMTDEERQANAAASPEVAPVVVTTQDEINSLAPGTIYQLPDGSQWTSGKAQ